MIAGSLLVAFAGVRPARVAAEPAGACVIGRRVYGYHPVQSAANDALAACPACDRTTADPRCASCDQSGCPLRHNRGDAR